MQSSVERLPSDSLSKPRFLAYVLIAFPTAVRKPSRCMPPSIVLMLFANEKIVSLYVSAHCSAHSTSMPSRTPLVEMIGCSGSFLSLRCSTNDTMPPS